MEKEQIINEIANIKVYLKELEINKKFWINRIKELEQQLKKLKDNKS